MRVDQGVALLVWRHSEKTGNVEYLILKRDKNWNGWELPKGHLEHGSHDATIFVELNEETGIQPVEVAGIDDLPDNLTFSYTHDQTGEEIVSDFKCFRVEVTQTAEVDTSNNPSDEHGDWAWMEESEAAEKLEYEEQRELLRKHSK